MLDLLTLLKRHAHSPSIALRSATDTLTHRALWARVSGVASWLEGRSEQRIEALENYRIGSFGTSPVYRLIRFFSFPHF